jgi:hypothetical protein
MASRPETSMTRIRTISSNVIGISVSEQGYDSDKRFRRSAACIAGLRHAVTRLLGLKWVQYRRKTAPLPENR